jgi:hypothetical protein
MPPRVPYKPDHLLKYGMQSCYTDPQTGAVTTARCLFCVHFEREGSSGVVPRRRSPTEIVKLFKTPFKVSKYISHLAQHPTNWAEYRLLAQGERETYFSRVPVPYVNTLDAHFSVGQSGDASHTIDASIIEGIIDRLLFNPEDEDGVSKTMALSIFKRHTESECYTYKVKNLRQYTLITSYVSCGASFRLATRVMDATREVTHLGYLSGITRRKTSQYVRAAVAISLQTCADMLRTAWAYSIALDSSAKRGSSYLDIRVRICLKDDIENLHLMALPMFERHTGEYMFELVEKLLGSLDRQWRHKVVGATADGAPNMMGTRKGVVTRIRETGLPGFYKIWCSLHQLDLTVQKSVMPFYHGKFYSTLTGMIGYLVRRYTLIDEMGGACPTVAATRWLSLGKVSRWLLRHRLRLLQYFEEFHTERAPPPSWWVHLAVCDTVMHEIDIAFIAGQGLRTLISQQAS